tara:strand:- start:28 stop:624 length:597 start_codon:yes stop_codon:yes gene_type:complete
MYKKVSNAYEYYSLSKPKNIYNEPLVACGNKGMGRGSWDQNFMCSERGGGVHQICVKNIGTNTNQFSVKTGQSDWSTERGNNNHCVCLGAWSLYNAKKNNKEFSDKNTKKLKCDAIPDYSLTNRYVNQFVRGGEGWEKWNGLEKDYRTQIIDGVHSMVDECYSDGNKQQQAALKKNYCDFAKTINKLNNTKFYKEMCN